MIRELAAHPDHQLVSIPTRAHNRWKRDTIDVGLLSRPVRLFALNVVIKTSGDGQARGTRSAALYLHQPRPVLFCSATLSHQIHQTGVLLIVTITGFVVSMAPGGKCPKCSQARAHIARGIKHRIPQAHIRSHQCLMPY